MVPDPDGNALVVEDLTEIVRVHAVHDEAHRAAAVDRVGGADDPQTRHPSQFLKRHGGQLVFMGGNRGHAQRIQVVDRRTKSDRLRGHRHAGLEPLRRCRIGRARHRHRLDH